VHIDAIKPVWREDVAAGWFNNLRPDFKSLMHPIDRDTPPSGPGWIVQIVGHHYNPSPTAEDLKLKPGERQTAFGPYQYLTNKILPSLFDPALRVEGVHHVALAWMTRDLKWTTDKGANNNGVTSTPIPLLARATPPVATGTPGAPGAEGTPGMAGGGMPGMPGPMTEMGRMPTGMPAGMPGMGMPGMPYGMGMGMVPGDRNQPQIHTLTRTDFLIQFLWQPPTQEGPPKSPEELKAEFTTKVAEATKAMREAEAKKSNAVVTLPKEEAIESASKAASREVEKVLSKAAAPAGPAAAPAAGAPAPAPAPGAPAAPPK
jgi:hypothetical protein